jgi:hypothetical protein
MKINLVKGNQAENWAFHIHAILKINKGQITKKPVSIKDGFLTFNYIAYQLNYHISITQWFPWSCAHEMDWPMGGDPRVGAGRAQSTSKDLAYRGRTLMLHEGLASVAFLGRGSDWASS